MNTEGTTAPEPKEVLTPAEAGALLHSDPPVHENTVREYLRQAKIPGRKIGGRWYIPRAALLRFIAGESVGENGSQDRERGQQPAPGHSSAISVSAAPSTAKVEAALRSRRSEKRGQAKRNELAEARENLRRARLRYNAAVESREK